MPSPVFATATKEFEASLSDVEDNLQFVERASWLRPRLGEMLAWDNINADTRIRAQAFMSQKDAQRDLLYRGMVILVAGAFEQFVRRILRDTVSHMSTPPGPYSGLDANLARRNVMYTGKALATIFDPLDHFGLNYEELCANVGTCVEKSVAVTLNPDAFALFVSSLTPTRLEEVLGRIGMKFDWNVIGRHKGVRAFFGTTKTNETSKAAEDYLKEFIKTRNLAAHTGSGGISVSSDDVQKCLQFFRQFSDALIEEVAAQLF